MPHGEQTPARAARQEAAGPAGTVFSLSEQETFDLGRSLGQRLSGGEVIVLEGPLGAGKTVFARGVAAGLGIDPDEISSPTFTLVHEHAGPRAPLLHIDLYRVEHPEEQATIGLEELLTSGAVVLVEWGERLNPALRRDAVTVRLQDLGESSRRIDLYGPGQRPQAPPAGDA
jgi:tRNA threonylcarbamoyladenosine biosynthesis protein TsaE